jgi:hypothetical protein
VQLPALFDRMQDFRIRCASDPARAGYRRGSYRTPVERAVAPNTNSRRRYLR